MFAAVMPQYIIKSHKTNNGKMEFGFFISILLISHT